MHLCAVNQPFLTTVNQATVHPKPVVFWILERLVKKAPGNMHFLKVMRYAFEIFVANETPQLSMFIQRSYKRELIMFNNAVNMPAFAILNQYVFAFLSILRV